MRVKVLKKHMVLGLEKYINLPNDEDFTNHCAISQALSPNCMTTFWEVTFGDTIYDCDGEVQDFIEKYDDLIRQYTEKEISKKEFIKMLPEPFILELKNNKARIIK